MRNCSFPLHSDSRIWDRALGAAAANASRALRRLDSVRCAGSIKPAPWPSVEQRRWPPAVPKAGALAGGDPPAFTGRLGLEPGSRAPCRAIWRKSAACARPPINLEELLAPRGSPRVFWPRASISAVMTCRDQHGRSLRGRPGGSCPKQSTQPLVAGPRASGRVPLPRNPPTSIYHLPPAPWGEIWMIPQPRRRPPLGRSSPGAGDLFGVSRPPASGQISAPPVRGDRGPRTRRALGP